MGTNRRNQKLFVSSTIVAWALAALSAAQPAGAVAMTTQGQYSYASCSANNNAGGVENDCTDYTWNFDQNIKFISTACSSGACSGTGLVFTDIVYGTGRKVTTLLIGDCGGSGYDVYGLGSCAC